jgi:hypothetical protein
VGFYYLTCTLANFGKGHWRRGVRNPPRGSARQRHGGQSQCRGNLICWQDFQLVPSFDWRRIWGLLVIGAASYSAPGECT